MDLLPSDRGNVMRQPMRVEQLVERAKQIQWDESFSVKNWLRSADLMVKQAGIYEHEGNDQMAFFLLYRHAELILNHLPKHAEIAKSPEQYKQARKTVFRSLAKLEVLKPRINKRYEYHQRKLQTRRSQQEAELHGAHSASAGSKSDASQDARPPSPEHVSADAYRDSAVALVNQHMGALGRYSMPDEDEHIASMQRVRQQIDRDEQQQQQQQQPRLSLNDTYHSDGAQYQYPTFPRPNDVLPARPPLPRPGDALGTPPQRPPKEAPADPRRPPRPPKTSIEPPSNSTALSFASSSQTEGGQALRSLFLPQPVKPAFLEIARANTARGIETCGMLCGTLLRNALFVTHLVIPSQTGTANTCEMTNEEELYAWIEQESIPPRDGHPGKEVMVLGWIHTHPTQTAFLSSRDLHTHVWYQASLPESIAVVCAPRQAPGQDYRVFRMTDPPGLPIIRSCKKTAAFHPHEAEDGGLYTDCAGKPGHVVEHADLKFSVVDLRRGM